MKKGRDLVLGGDAELEARLRTRVKQAIRQKKDRNPKLADDWLTRIEVRHTDFAIPEASLFLLLFRQFENGPIRGLPQVMEWLRKSAGGLRSLKSVVCGIAKRGRK